MQEIGQGDEYKAEKKRANRAITALELAYRTAAFSAFGDEKTPKVKKPRRKLAKLPPKRARKITKS